MAFPNDEQRDAVDLTDAINAVHKQLTAAIRNVPANDVLDFEYGNVEVELQMTATKLVF